MRSLVVRLLANLRMRSATKWVVVVVAAVILTMAFLWFVPVLQVSSFSKIEEVEAKDILAQTNEYRRTWAQIIAGLIVLLGLYFTWRRVEIAQEQQVTERFTRAIDQLGAADDRGHKKLEIRLGGIYALERIARDSARDHWPIMETLTTYAREHAPLRPTENTQETGFIRPPQTAQRQQAPNKPDDGLDPETIPVPEPDIQAILTVIRRRTRHYGNGEVERLALHETDLRRGNLGEAHLERAYLGGAHLEGADLGETHLEEAVLFGAHLEGADLEGANLWGAHLDEEQIEQAIGIEATKLPEGLKMPKSWANGASE